MLLSTRRAETTDTRSVYNDTEYVHDDDRLLDVPCDDLNEGDASYPAQETRDALDLEALASRVAAGGSIQW